MRTFPRRLVVCLGLVLLVLPAHVRMAVAGITIVAPPNKKRHIKHAPDWTPPAEGPAAEHATLPTEASPTINPDAMPSASLQPFLDTHLDKILAPLGAPAFVQTDLVEDMKEGYAGALPAAPDARKPAYQLAAGVCDALTGAIEQRQKAVAALNGAYERRKSESIQPRGGKQAVKESDKDEAFFYDSQKNNWLQNASALRQQIAALYRRERAAEMQAGEWTPPAPVAAAAPTPSVAAAAPEVDPVIGDWTWQNNGPLKLEADHSISGSRQGTWQYTCTTDAGRNYEMHWKHKGWVDYVVLSTDGKMLDGKSNKGKHVTANR